MSFLNCWGVKSDHPRLRGEHATGDQCRTFSQGSSPPTRGTRVARRIADARAGIIPAYAGNTHSLFLAYRDARDHPRLRGEHAQHRRRLEDCWGSSPPTRGTRLLSATCRPPVRIIPAYAGNTHAANSGASPMGDHPRLRGEHQVEPVLLRRPAGSSPPTRGTLFITEGDMYRLRIIPAYAGNTPSDRRWHTGFRDHPRLRGEHAGSQFSGLSFTGSSPPTRGTRLGSPHTGWLPGIIPAYAGNTGGPPQTMRCLRDHPRLRGEHSNGISCNALLLGSSPPTRGTPRDGADDLVACRIIPAYAGNTIRSQ